MPDEDEELREQRLVRLFLERTEEVVCVLDATGRLVYASPSFEKVTGRPLAAVLGRPSDVRGFVHPADEDRVVTAIARACGGDSEHEVVEYRGCDVEDVERWFEMTITDQLADPVLQGVVLHIRDVTDRRRADAEVRFRSTLIDAIGQPVIVTRPGGVVQFWNDAATEVFGWSAEEAVGRHISAVTTTPEGWADVLRRIDEELRDGDLWVGDTTLRRKDGSVFPAHVTNTRLRDDDGTVIGNIGVTTDLTELVRLRESRRLDKQRLAETQRAARDELVFRARHDTLTGLPNRNWLTTQLTDVLLAVPAEGHVHVALLDIDRFKHVNVSHGNRVGDLALCELAARVRSVCRPDDVVGRFGGDELLVIRAEHDSDECDDQHGSTLAADLTAAVARPMSVAGRRLRLTASVGVATGRRGDVADHLLRDVDSAMNEAKAKGRARHYVYDDTLRGRAQRRLELENGLRRALDRRDVQVHYQPVVDMRTGTTVGLEALVRWEHPTLGPVPPEEFVPIAEERGLIFQLGDHVLRQATAALAAWRRDGCCGPAGDDLWVAVNLSARQLAIPNLVGAVTDILDQTGLPPSNLHLEITESVLMDDVETSLDITRTLSAMGIGISIDDFGTGYSSLSYLKRLPVTTLKVDRSFVEGVAHDPHDAAIVSTVVDLARSLGMNVVAEGVEDDEQLTVLRRIGCAFGQGYRWGRPADGDATVRRLRQVADG